MSKNNKYILYSGGAYGADTYWGLVGLEYGVDKQIHYRPADNPRISKELRERGIEPTLLSNEELLEGYKSLFNMYNKQQYKSLENDLKARNYFQVINSDGVFAIGNLINQNVSGGTNVAVQLAKIKNKILYVFNLLDEKWYEYSKKYYKFVESDTPTLPKKFAGIGTRGIQLYNIQKNGIWVPNPSYLGENKERVAFQAIRDVYNKTFKLK